MTKAWIENLRELRCNQPKVSYEEALKQTEAVRLARKDGEKKRHLDCIGIEGCKASTETVQEN